MLAEDAANERRRPVSATAGRRKRGVGGQKEVLARIAAFVVAAAIVVAYALPGGSYDIVIRQEYGLVIWAVLALGIGLGLLPRSRPSRPALIVLGALVAYAAWTGISLAWTDSAERTTAELARTLDYVGFCALVGSVIDRRLWRAATAGLGAGALIVCALAVASRLFPGDFPHNVVGIVFDTDRLSYPFGYWNAVAAWGAMSIAIALSWGSNDGWKLRRVLMVAGAPVAGTMVYLSYSRAGVAGAALAVAASIGLSRFRWTAAVHAAVAGFGTALVINVIRSHPQIAHGTGGSGSGSVLAVLVFACVLSAFAAWLCTVVGTDRWKLPRPAYRVLAGACTIAVVLAAVAFGPHIAKHAWHEFRNPALPSAASNPTQRLTTLSGTRYNLWAVAFQAFKEYPLTGTGAGTYEFWWNRHMRDSESVLNAHSLWLEAMAELGAPGLLAIVAFAAGALWLLVKVRRRAGRRTSTAASTAAAAAFIVFLLHASVDWMWQTTAVTILALGGLAAVSARLSSGPFRLNRVARVMLAVAAVLAAAIQLPGVLSTLEIRRSQAAERAGNGTLALAWAKAAVSSEPWAASPYDQEGLVLESAGRLAQAAAELRHAIDKEPDNYAHWLLLARVQSERGLLGLAARDYARAHALQTKGDVFVTPVVAPSSPVQAARG
jgi:hypothetical protein